MAVTVAASRLGTAAYDDQSPVELRASYSREDAEIVIRARSAHELDVLIQCLLFLILKTTSRRC
jgi:hypothetical protein